MIGKKIQLEKNFNLKNRSGVGEWLSSQGERRCGVWRGTQLVSSYTNEKLGKRNFLEISYFST
jgi:hypothetical protein